MSSRPEGARLAAESAWDAIDVAEEVLSGLEGAALWPLSGGELEEMLISLATLRAVVDRLEVAAVREGAQRGVHRERGFGVVDWVCAVVANAGLSADPAHVSRINRVAGLASRPAAVGVHEAFTAGVLPLGKADQLGRFEADVTPVADPEQAAQTLEILVEGASDTADGLGLTPKELKVAMGRSGRLLKPERDLVAEQDAAARGRALYKRQGPAGLSEYRVLLDPEGSAVVDAAVASLSSPVAGADGEPDPRSAAARRADALLEIIGRGVSAPGELPRNAKAQVVVTIGLEQLLEGLGGAGVTATGEVLAPDVLRRMACDAGIVPMILGGAGEVLDVGRELRFFTAAQRRVLWQRDGGCSFPGARFRPSGATRIM